MLDQLDLLDDATPPEPDSTMLGQVRARAGRRRRHIRLAVSAALVVAIACVVGVTTLTNNDQRQVEVRNEPTKSSLVTQGRLPNGLDVRMSIGSSTVVLGSDIVAHIDVRNDTGRTQTIGPDNTVQCALGVQPSLRDSKGGYSTTDGRESICLHVSGMPPRGMASFTARVSTERLTLPDGEREGRYELALLNIPTDDSSRELTSSTPPIAVDVVAPDLTVQLKASSSTTARSQLIKGTVVFNNASGETIDAGCEHSLSYRVSLAADGVVLNRLNQSFSSIGPTSASCRQKVRLLPPGTTAFPFSFPAQFLGCSPSRAGPELPRCISRIGRPVVPPLPFGRYEVVFEGRGPLGSVHVEPVPIRVVPLGR